MTVFFGLGTRLRVCMRTTLENGEGLITEKIPYEISKSWDFAKDFRISGKISRFQSRFQDFTKISGFHLTFQDFT